MLTKMLSEQAVWVSLGAIALPLLLYLFNTRVVRERRKRVLLCTRHFMTGDQNVRVRDHVRRKLNLADSIGDEFVEDRKLQAKHVLRRMYSFQRKAKNSSLRMLANAPKNITKAFQTR